MAILRKTNKQKYTTILHDITLDPNLSLKDLGLLVKLLSLPDNWEFSEKGLETILKKDGQTSIRTAIKNLEKFGYLKRERVRDEFGRVLGVEWYIFEEPQINGSNGEINLNQKAENKLQDNQNSLEPKKNHDLETNNIEEKNIKNPNFENHNLDIPNCEKHKQYNINRYNINRYNINNVSKKESNAETEKNDQENKKDVVTDKSLQIPKQLNANILTTKDSISQTTKESQGKRKSFNEIIEEYTDDVELQSALKEHLRVRVANKKGLTNGVLEKALKRLSELTHKVSEKIAIVNNAIASGNVTFYPLNDKEKKMLDKPSYNIEEYENYDIMDYCNMLERHEEREREQASKWRHEFLGEEYDII